MKKILLLIMVLSSLSCYDGLNDMLANLDMKVPICVNSVTGSDLDNGRGWVNAKATIQAAINAADAGDEIWIAGTFSPNIIITKPVSLYGGFKGSESRLEERDINNKTSINGGGNAFEIQTQNVMLDGFKFNKSSDYGVLIDDINTPPYNAIINNCEFTGNQAPAIVLMQGSVEIHNSNFHDNTATPVSISNGSAIIADSTFTNNSGSNGGAILCMSCTAVITGCHFGQLDGNGLPVNGNTATANGGAIYSNASIINITGGSFDGNSATGTGSGGAICATTGSSITITGTDFISNTSKGGGAINLGSTSTLTVTGGSFDGNQASNTVAFGGAIFAASSGQINLNGITFTKNHAANNGGAIYTDTVAAVNITGCTFGSNGATASADKNYVDADSGGALYSTNSTLTLTNDKFYGNTASSGNGGAINILNLSTVTVESCSFGTNDANISVNANSAKSGGAIYSDNSTLTILNDKFYGNKATDGQGGAVYYIANNIHLTVNDSDFTGNTATSSGGALHLQDGGGSSNYNITNTTFDGNTTTGTGGAIHISQGHCNISQSVIKNCISAVTGGGINIEENIAGNLTVSRCQLLNNSSGAFNGSSIWQNSGELKIYDSLIFRDTAAGLNLIYTDTIYSIDVVNCTFIDKTTSGSIGSFWASNSANAKIYNTVFYGLSINCNGSNFYNTGASSGVISAIEASADTNTYGITSADFTSFSSNNFLPASTSANLVNKGMNPISDYTFSSVDLAGHPRIAGGIVDIGCYERQ